jgi:indole-3-acetate monooxygenase
MPEAIVRGMVEHGLFRLWIPARYGGFEFSLPAALQVYEAAARVDGSFGWAVMIGSGGGLFAAYLEPAAAAGLFAPRAAVVAGSGAPGGIAERVAGGFRVSGRWRYASGAHYATVFTASCRITQGGKPVPHVTTALIRAMSFRPADVTIHDTWDASGLRATGSHDMAVSNVFVPAAATFSVFVDQPREAGPLYRLPFEILTELPVSAVALGAAQRAVDEFESLACHKPAHGGTAPLEQSATVRDAISSARARIGASRLSLYAQADSVWEAAQAGGRPDPHVGTQLTVNAVRELVAAVAGLVPYAGMNAIRADDEFAVAWRDLEATAAHYSVSPICLLNAPA